jgi:hypothetical protein
MYSKKNEKKKLWKRKLLSAKNHNQFQLNHEKKCKNKKGKENKKNKRKKNKRERIKVIYRINILSILRHIIAISQPFMICTLFYFLYGCENTKKCSNLS